MFYYNLHYELPTTNLTDNFEEHSNGHRFSPGVRRP